MTVIEKSNALPELAAQSSLLRARVDMAEQRLRLIILGELSAWGIPCDSEAVDKIIAGLPKDTLYRLLAELT